MACRLFPPIQSEMQSRLVAGRVLRAKPGEFVDVSEDVALAATEQGWTLVGPVGPTEARPAGRIGFFSLPQGYAYLDLTLGRVVIWDGDTYRDPATGGAV